MVSRLGVTGCYLLMGNINGHPNFPNDIAYIFKGLSFENRKFCPLNNSAILPAKA